MHVSAICFFNKYTGTHTNQHNSYYFVLLFKKYLRNMVAAGPPPTCTFTVRFSRLLAYETAPNQWPQRVREADQHGTPLAGALIAAS